LLTCEPEDLRGPEAGLRIAERAMAKSGGENPVILDTLALAYFMTGDTPNAIETQEKAVAFLPTGKSKDRTDFEGNLAKYRAALEKTQMDPKRTEAEAQEVP
jgi:hypothetical protein